MAMTGFDQHGKEIRVLPANDGNDWHCAAEGDRESLVTDPELA
jgi:hypothetical protein